MNTKQELLREMQQNETVIQIFPAEALVSEWEAARGTVRTVANYVAPAFDALTLSKIVRDLGMFGRVETVIKNGTTYVIFKGTPGHRTVFRGTRYLASNPKVVRFAIGPKGVLKSVKGGAVITAVLFVGIDVLEYFLRDAVKLHMMLGRVSSDLIQIGISSICGALAGLYAGSFALVALPAGAPLVAAVAVGVLVGITLSIIDDRFGATKALMGAYESMGIELVSTWDAVTSFPSTLVREVVRWERHMVNQAMRGRVQGY